MWHPKLSHLNPQVQFQLGKVVPKALKRLLLQLKFWSQSCHLPRVGREKQNRKLYPSLPLQQRKAAKFKRLKLLQKLKHKVQSQLPGKGVRQNCLPPKKQFHLRKGQLEQRFQLSMSNQFHRSLRTQIRLPKKVKQLVVKLLLQTSLSAPK